MKRPIKPSPAAQKLAKHRERCADLYNRLQAGDHTGPIVNLCKIVCADDFDDLYNSIMLRSSCTIRTYQINADREPVFQITLEYEDRLPKPLHGYLYPTKTVIKTSHSMGLGAILCYIELCKQLGRFY